MTNLCTMDSTEHYVGMQKKMKSTWSSAYCDKCDHDKFVANLKIGQTVRARTSIDEDWYVAKVTNIAEFANGKEFTVSYELPSLHNDTVTSDNIKCHIPEGTWMYHCEDCIWDACVTCMGH